MISCASQFRNPNERRNATTTYAKAFGGSTIGQRYDLSSSETLPVSIEKVIFDLSPMISVFGVSRPILVATIMNRSFKRWQTNTRGLASAV